MSGEVKRRPSAALSSDRWKTLEPLIDAAVELSPDRRAAFLLDACNGDSALNAELLALLADYERSDAFLERPAAAHFASLFIDDVVPVPELLGGYRVEREIGRGGTATVYLAHDLRHDRDVALKVLRPQFAAALGPDRFLAEIRTTALLSHPGILPLYDSGEDAGFLFYVMPYVQGESLRRRLEREPQLPLEAAVRIASDVAGALEAAHAKGIIHRDVKPENILLQDGIALVADFGIALALSTAGSRLTESGLALGTPTYMSPEQASGDAPIDARSDVYALGSVVYEMLAGEPPFTGSTPTAILAKRAATPAPALRILRPAVPKSLEAMVARALAREPVDRYRTAGEFADALRRALAQRDSGEVLPPAIAPHAHPVARAEATRARLGRRVSVAALLALGVAAIVPVARAAWRRATSAVLDPNRIVIAPFRVTGDDASQNTLAEGLVDRLAPMLDGKGGPSAVDSRTALAAWSQINGRREATANVARDVARRVGAGKTLFGTVLVSQHRLTLTASLVDAQSGDLHALVSVTGSSDSLQTLLDGLVAQILVRHAAIPEQTVNALVIEPLPALRPYLDGRMAYRRAHDAEAIRDLSRALEIDSTFAHAALDLAIATTKLLRQQRVCRNESCRSVSVVPGFRDTGPESDDAVFDRAIRLAWDARAKLGAGDLPLLQALGGHIPRVSTAREMLMELEQASTAAPDRGETQYFIGLILLYQGGAIGYSDSFAQAEARFLRAIDLDPTYVPPRARLVDIAAYERNAAKLARYGAEYLARDSTTGSADYVRWRVAVGTADSSAHRRLRARFDSLDLSTLSQIVTASQMTGLGLEDADRAATLIINRSMDPLERGFYWGHMLALNRGRPRIADSLLRVRAEHDSSRLFFSRAFVTWDVMFGPGDSAAAEAASRTRARLLARDTASVARRPASPSDSSGRSSQEILQDARAEVFQEALWSWSRGQLETSAELTRWLRAHGALESATISDMLVATERDRSDAAALRAHVDSAARNGCCAPPNHIELLLATAFERAGDDTAALAAVQRGKWRYPTMYLSTYLLMEGCLATRTNDRSGAIRAYEHYLALRSDPAPHLRPQRDSVQAEVVRLRSLDARAQTNVGRAECRLRALRR